MTEHCQAPTPSLDHLGLDHLAAICTSSRWQALMLEQRPYQDFDSLSQSASDAFDQLQEQDWLEAYSGHPMIGDLSTLQEKYAQGKTLSEEEQSGVSSASDEVLQQLLTENQRYLEKYGFIFIVFASNKSAGEMLSLLKTRITNPRHIELKNAATEQRKISQHRMEVYR